MRSAVPAGSTVVRGGDVAGPRAPVGASTAAATSDAATTSSSAPVLGSAWRPWPDGSNSDGAVAANGAR